MLFSFCAYLRLSLNPGAINISKNLYSFVATLKQKANLIKNQV